MELGVLKAISREFFAVVLVRINPCKYEGQELAGLVEPLYPLAKDKPPSLGS